MRIININIFTKLKNFLKPSSPIFATRISFLLCICLAAIGIYLGITFRSLAVETNGLISVIDVFNSLLILAAVGQSIRSPDYIYNYGYGKYESMTVLLSAVLLTIILSYTFYETMLDIGSPVPVESHQWLIVYSMVSFILMKTMSKYLKKASVNFHLPMLDYDSTLWKMDSYFELGILANLFTGAILNMFNLNSEAKIIDSASASLIALVSLIIPLKHGKDAIGQLLDRTLPEHIQFEIIAVIAENFTRMCEFKSVHTRKSGKDIFIELDIVMPFDFHLEQIHKLETSINNSLKIKYPTAIVRLYFTPCKRDCFHYDKRSCPIKIANSLIDNSNVNADSIIEKNSNNANSSTNGDSSTIAALHNTENALDSQDLPDSINPLTNENNEL